MNSDAAYELIKICLTEAFIVAAPIVGLCLVVGVTVSLFQTITTIQEQTLTFVPKVVAVLLVIAFTSPWMISLIVDFTTTLWGTIPNMVK